LHLILYIILFSMQIYPPVDTIGEVPETEDYDIPDDAFTASEPSDKYVDTDKDFDGKCAGDHLRIVAPRGVSIDRHKSLYFRHL
jgi:hypothetical protein